MVPYCQSVILQLNRDFDKAERNSKMPKMFNGLTWEKTKQKIEERLREYFEAILSEREIKLKAKHNP